MLRSATRIVRSMQRPQIAGQATRLTHARGMPALGCASQLSLASRSASAAGPQHSSRIVAALTHARHFASKSLRATDSWELVDKLVRGVPIADADDWTDSTPTALGVKFQNTHSTLSFLGMDDQHGTRQLAMTNEAATLTEAFQVISPEFVKEGEFRHLLKPALWFADHLRTMLLIPNHSPATDQLMHHLLMAAEFNDLDRSGLGNEKRIQYFEQLPRKLTMNGWPVSAYPNFSVLVPKQLAEPGQLLAGHAQPKQRDLSRPNPLLPRCAIVIVTDHPTLNNEDDDWEAIGQRRLPYLEAQIIGKLCAAGQQQHEMEQHSHTPKPPPAGAPPLFGILVTKHRFSFYSVTFHPDFLHKVADFTHKPETTQTINKLVLDVDDVPTGRLDFLDPTQRAFILRVLGGMRNRVMQGEPVPTETAVSKNEEAQ